MTRPLGTVLQSDFSRPSLSIAPREPPRALCLRQKVLEPATELDVTRELEATALGQLTTPGPASPGHWQSSPPSSRLRTGSEWHCYEYVQNAVPTPAPTSTCPNSGLPFALHRRPWHSSNDLNDKPIRRRSAQRPRALCSALLSLPLCMLKQVLALFADLPAPSLLSSTALLCSQ